MGDIVAVSTPEERVEQLLKAVVQQDVLAVLYYAAGCSRGESRGGVDSAGQGGRSALVTAVAAPPTDLSLILVAILLRMYSCPAAGSPSAFEVAREVQNDAARRLMEGKDRESLEYTTAELLCSLSLPEAEVWIAENLSTSNPPPSSSAPASVESSETIAAERPSTPRSPPHPGLPQRRETFSLPARPNTPPSPPSKPSHRFSTLKVENLPPSLTGKALEAIYKWCKGFVGAELMGSHGFVRFETEQDARAAYWAKKGVRVYNHQIFQRLVQTPSTRAYRSLPSSTRPSRSRSPPARSRSPLPAYQPRLDSSRPVDSSTNSFVRGQPKHQSTIVLRNIPDTLGASAISALLTSSIRSGFSPFKINFNNITPYTFIDLEDPTDVPRAISALHGRRFGSQTLVVEAGQVGKDHPWRISFPDLPPSVRNVEDLETLVEAAGARRASCTTIHTSLGGLDGRDGNTTHFGFSNVETEREMDLVIERMRDRGVVARRFSTVAERTRMENARGRRGSGGWRRQDDGFFTRSAVASGRFGAWDYADGKGGRQSEQARRERVEAMERRGGQHAADGHRSRNWEGGSGLEEAYHPFKRQRRLSPSPSHRPQQRAESTFASSSTSARSSFANDSASGAPSCKRWLD